MTHIEEREEGGDIEYRKRENSKENIQERFM